MVRSSLRRSLVDCERAAFAGLTVFVLGACSAGSAGVSPDGGAGPTADVGTRDASTSRHDAGTSLHVDAGGSSRRDAGSTRGSSDAEGERDAGGTAKSDAADSGPAREAGNTSASCAFDGVYDSAANKYPPGGCFPWYPKSVLKMPLPAHPVIDPNSQAYNKAQGHNNASGAPQLSGFGAGPASEPVYYTHGNGIDLKVSCGANGIGYGVHSCEVAANEDGTGAHVDVNGATINFPPSFVIEASGDAHMARIDSTLADEFEAWDTTQPTNIANGQTFDVGTAGLCDLHGDGSGCSGSTATSLPYSLGLVKAEDILACLASNDDHCTLPYAVAMVPVCNGTRYVYPATWSDGQCFNYPGTEPANTLRPVEGARGFLALTDDQVNALDVPAYEKIFLRTIDQEHFGFVDSDTGYSLGPGFAPQAQGSAPYDVYGNPNPWVALATMAGITAGSDGSYSFPLQTSALDLVTQIQWCLPTSSGLCDGMGDAASDTN